MQWSEEYRDTLTGLWRRDILFGYLEDKVKEKAGLPKSEQQFSIVLLDLDHFKMLNDRYGHLFGDKVIKLIASSVDEGCKKRYPDRSLVVRYGGDEMVMVLDKISTGEVISFTTALLNKITSDPFFNQIEDRNVTASAGVAVFPRDSVDPKELFEKADKALYVSKKFRANKVILAQQAVFATLFSKIKLLFSFIVFLAFLAFVGYIAYSFIYHKSMGGDVEVTLTYGATMQGKVVYQDNKIIVLELTETGSQFTINKDKIKSIKNISGR